MTCGKIKFNSLFGNNYTPDIQPIFKINKLAKLENNTEIFTTSYDNKTNSYNNSDNFIELEGLYNGKVKVPVTRIDNTIYLISNILYNNKNIQIVLYDLNDIDDSKMQVEFENPDNVINNINSNKYNIVKFNINNYNDDIKSFINAYYCIIEYNRFLNFQFSRVGLTNTAHNIVSFVNVRMTNAFWCGFCMVFGNARDPFGPRNAKPLTAMDVCCHELTHGLINMTVDLKYEGESGALNESIADIFGTYMEFFVNSPEDTPDWTLGEEFNFIIRNLANPKQYRQPNTYCGQYWVDPNNIQMDNGGVHINSGITNFFTYLTVNGKNGFFNDYNKYFDIKQIKELSFNNLIQIIFALLDKHIIPATCSFNQFATNLLDYSTKIKQPDIVLKHLKTCFNAVGLLVNNVPESPNQDNTSSDNNTEPEPTPYPDPNPNPNPCPTPVPEPYPEPYPEPTPEPTPEPYPTPYPEPYPTPAPEPQISYFPMTRTFNAYYGITYNTCINKIYLSIAKNYYETDYILLMVDKQYAGAKYIEQGSYVYEFTIPQFNYCVEIYILTQTSTLLNSYSLCL